MLAFEALYVSSRLSVDFVKDVVVVVVVTAAAAAAANSCTNCDGGGA